MDAPLLGTYGQVSSSSDAAPVDVDTPFMLASISKTFAGATVAVLVDQGLLSLDDDICNVTGGVMIDKKLNTACRNPAYPDTNVTWRMLLTHRSSLTMIDLPDVGENTSAVVGPSGVGVNLGYNEVVGNPACPLEDSVQFFEDLLVDKPTETTVGNLGYSVNWYDLAEEMFGGMWNATYPPGAFHSYSNVGVAYIASLIERLTGEKFEKFSAANVFAPAGMNRTAWFLRDLPNGTVAAAPVYYDFFSDTWVDIGHYCYINFASGQLYSSIHDMATYADLMLSYGVGTLWSNNTAMEHVFGCQERNWLGELMSDDSLECQQALSWFHLSNAMKFVPDDDSIAEWEMPEIEALDWTNGITHNGYDSGVSTDAVILPESDSYVIVLLNTDGADQSYFSKVITLEGMALLNGKPPVGTTGYPFSAETGDGGIITTTDDAVLGGDGTGTGTVTTTTTTDPATGTASGTVTGGGTISNQQ
jgi:CubicO group peptidase (beta-lactamase class C family)